MTDFMNSTQLLYWSFPKSEAIRAAREEFNADKPLPSKDLEEFRLLLENEIVRFMQHGLQGVNVRLETIHIAVSYLKRFMLRTSILEYQPLMILLACVYLALKVDETHVGIVNFARFAKAFLVCYLDEDFKGEILCKQITHHEVIVVEKINYQIMIHCPLKALRGFFMDMANRWPDASTALLEKIRPASEKMVTKAVLADCLFLYAPSAIALTAIVFSACSENNAINLDSYMINSLLGGQDNAIEQAKKMRTTMRKIWNLIKEDEKIRQEASKVSFKERLAKINVFAPSWNPHCDASMDDELEALDVDKTFGM